MTSAARTEAVEQLEALAAMSGVHRTQVEARLVRDHFDATYYLETNPDLLESGEDPVAHFCARGWRELRKPRRDFDVWWYWANHLDPGSDAVNPLVHYALTGAGAGLTTQPTSTSARPGSPLGPAPRRACLFAGYDAEGVLDPSTLLLIEELARWCDVYYLSDGYMPDAELAKLDGIVAGAWAVRHGRYDFGSYAMLASELVGWETLTSYDEVLFVNDSCFLVRPLDYVFSEMATRPCDWWGLQATKGIASTRDQAGNDFTDPIPMDRVRDELLASYEKDAVYDFLVGSYFLAFRAPVIADPTFQKLISSVTQQPSKLLVILKYEIGLTHLLIGRGFSFDTYMASLYPFHPIFTDWYFELLDAGFPLLKRYFIYQNHYDVPDIDRWRDRVRAVSPDAPIEVFERTLERTAPDDRLRRSYGIHRDAAGKVVVPDGAVKGAFRRQDLKRAKRPDSWVFVVDPATNRLPDSSRAIIAALRDEPVTPVVLTRGRPVELDGVVSAPVMSPEGRDHLFGAGRVFVAEAPRRAVSGPLAVEDRTIVVVRPGGLVLESTGSLRRSPTRQGPSDHEVPATPPMTAVLTASNLDHLAAVAASRPASFHLGWRTGLPLHDFLHCAHEELPDDLRQQEAQLRSQLDGRRLLLFTPTARRSGTSAAPYPFSPAEVDRLVDWARRNDVVIGLREHLHDQERAYAQALGDNALDLGHRLHPSTPVVLRAASAVLTDYASAALDVATTGRPTISFVHDPEDAAERTALDLHHLFPGPVCHDTDALFDVLERLDTPSAAEQAHADRVRSLLADWRDASNGRRLIDRVLAHVPGGTS